MTNILSRAAILLSIATATSPLALSAKPFLPYVSDAARETVSDDFPYAKDVQWGARQDAGVYTAYMTNHGVKTTVDVGQDGALLSVLRYFEPSGIPARFRDILASQFPGRTTVCLIEYTDYTSDDQERLIQATMEDADHLYTVRIEGQKAKVTQTIEKQ
jgi:hypothetical protein